MIVKYQICLNFYRIRILNVLGSPVHWLSSQKALSNLACCGKVLLKRGLSKMAHTYFVPKYNLPQTHFDPKHTLAPRHSKSCLKIRPYLLVSAKASYEILRHSRDNTLIGRPPPVTMLRNHYTKEVKRIRDAHKNYDFDTFTFY